MKVKKVICTLAAVALAGIALAGNTSDMSVFINDFFSPLEQDAQAKNDASAGKKEVNTVVALKNGLLVYDTCKTTRQLAGLNQEIDTALEITLPNILNKMKTSITEVQEEMRPVLKKLTEDVVANQDEVKAENVDSVRAQEIMASFVFIKLLEEGKVLVRVSYILQGQNMKQKNLKYSITEFFSSIEKDLRVKGDPYAHRQTATTVAALKGGLLTYAEHKASAQLTPLDKDIDTVLTKTLPNTFNKIKRSSLEIQEEVFPIISKGTTDVLNNQEAVNREEINIGLARDLFSQFVFTKVQEDGSLLINVSRILSAETLDKLINLVAQQESTNSISASR